MEKFKTNEHSSKRLRTALVAGGLGLATILLATGCGQATPPEGKDLEQNVQYLVLDDVTAADGKPTQCLFYSEDGNHRSWLTMDCDFEGSAHFPGEPATTTTSTTTTTIRER